MGLRHLGSIGLALLLAGTTACGASTTATRKQPAFYDAPPQTPIALVTVDVPPWVMDRAPSDFANMHGLIRAALEASLQGTSFRLVDRTDLEYRMVIGPKAPDSKRIWVFETEEPPALPADQLYIAEEPRGLPVGVKEPLVLGVQVTSWRLRRERFGDAKKSVDKDVALVDLVYSLWTTKGDEVETVRVRTKLVAGDPVTRGITLLPNRNHWMSFSDQPSWRFQTSERAREALFKQAIQSSAAAFAFPFRGHDVGMRAIWDDSNEAVKPGIALADAKDFEGAMASWQAVVDADPNNAAALFNIGQVLEVQARDQEAAEVYERALALAPKNSQYRLYLGRAKERAGLRRVLVP